MLTTTVCAALSAAGLAVAFLTAFRRRFVAATRVAALALVPVGLAMTGLVTLGGRIGRAVAGWAADLAFRPTVWAGFAVLAAAVVLYAVARVAAGRRGSRAARRAAAGAGRAPVAAGPGGGRPALGGTAPPSAVVPSADTGRTAGGPPAGGGGADDFSDIEAILKKHGI